MSSRVSGTTPRSDPKLSKGPTNQIGGEPDGCDLPNRSSEYFESNLKLPSSIPSLELPHTIKSSSSLTIAYPLLSERLPLDLTSSGVRRRASEIRKVSHYRRSSRAPEILAHRGFPADARSLHEFLQPSIESLPNPAAATGGLHNFIPVVKTIATAIRTQASFAIACDYDVDGLTGGAQLKLLLDSLGARNSVYVPHRLKDGYGLNNRIVKSALRDGHTVLVTVDFGSTNHASIKYAERHGMTVIVIDHHTIGDHTAPTKLFINPHQPQCGFAEGILCASGIVSFVVQGVYDELDKNTQRPLWLPALGTVCDVVDLVGPNRTITKNGLLELAERSSVGISELMKKVRIVGEPTAGDVGFRIGPCINAAGRIASPDVVIELLTTTDRPRAKFLANLIHSYNEQRKLIERQLVQEAERQLLESDVEPHSIFIWGKSYHKGVIGLAAQRISDKYFRPTIVLGGGEKGMFSGSGRSGREDFDLYAALKNIESLFSKYGGHRAAAGLSISQDHLERARLSFEAEVADQLRGKTTTPTVHWDLRISLDKVSEVMYSQITPLGPFGKANPEPLMYVEGVTIKRAEIFKDHHLKLELNNGKVTRSALLRYQTEHPAVKVGSKVNVVGRITPPLEQYFDGYSLYLSAIAEA